MKKLAPLLLVFVVILSFALGCTSQQTSAPGIAQTAPPVAEPTPIPTPTPPPEPSPEPTTVSPSPKGELKVHFINVGQGDAILIDLEHIEVLIDGGDRSPGVVSYLKNYVDGVLEVMIATHPHADHIGGLIDVLATFEVQEIWQNGDTAASKTYSDFMSVVNGEHARVFQALRGNTIVADGLIFEVLHPENLNASTNNNSIVLHLAYGQIDFLFTGDAEKEAEAAMLLKSDMPVPDVEILKVGHHGSETASSADFLAVTTPEIAIYMAGEDNRYGHPHEATIRALCDVGAKIYGIDVHGSIIITTDGEGYEIQLEKQAPSVKLATEG